MDSPKKNMLQEARQKNNTHCMVPSIGFQKTQTIGSRLLVAWAGERGGAGTGGNTRGSTKLWGEMDTFIILTVVMGSQVCT